MDETKETQDVTTSKDTKGTSEQPETFTKEHVAEAERKGKSDALAEVGRLKKSTEAAIAIAQKATARLDKMIQDQDDAELKAHEGDPEKLSAIGERQKRRMAEGKLADAESELSEEKAKTAEAQEAGAQHTKERNAREVATRLGVDAKTLIKFTDGSTEAMEELAKSLPKKGETKPLLVDSSKTIGGGSSFEQIRDEMIKNPSDDAKMRRYMEATKTKKN